MKGHGPTGTRKIIARPMVERRREVRPREARLRRARQRLIEKNLRLVVSVAKNV